MKGHDRTQRRGSARLLNHRAPPVQLHRLEDEQAPAGPAVETLMCMHEREGVLTDICFGGVPVEQT